MNGSVFDYPAFRPVPLLLYVVFAALLYGSWTYVDATRMWWDSADMAVFRTLNDSLRGAVWWQHLWAVGNNNFFDFLSVLLILWVLFHYITAEGEKYITERVAVTLTIGLVLAGSAMLSNLMDDIRRYSPTAVLPDVFLLTEHVHWLKTKDISYNSYPSDHATILLILSLMMWHFAGRRAGLIMLGAAFFFTFPRVIGGAHWFTDVMTGSVPLALLIVSIAIYTPLHRPVIRFFMRILRIPFVAACVATGTHKEAPLLVAKGCCMGAADVVPGVSGGTVAYILGIWHRLIEAIKSIDTAWFKLLLTLRWTEAIRKAHLEFLVPLVIGLALAIITFTRFIPLPTLIITHPEPIYGLFFGLIAGSIILLLQETGRLGLKDICVLALGIGLGWLVVNIVPVDTPEDTWFIFLCGAIAISAMLLPGLSGSFILLIMGKYAYILGAVGAFKFSVIIPFAVGCLVGLAAFSRAAAWLLHHYYRICVLAIIGILIGSSWIIWPFQQREFALVRDKQRLISSTPIWPESLDAMDKTGVILMILGFVMVLTLGMFAAHKRRMLPPPPQEQATTATTSAQD